MDPLSQGLSLQFVTRLADDAADQAAFISGWEQDYAQISCGRFSGRLDELCLGRLQVFREYSARETYQQCQPWRGAIWFGIPAPGSGERLRFHGRSVPPSAVLVAMGGSDFTLRTPDDFTIYGIVPEQEVLASRHQQLFGRDLPAHWLQSAAVRLPEASHRLLCGQIYELLALARQTPDSIGRQLLLDCSVDALLLALSEGQAEASLRREGSSQRHWQWVEQARQRALQPASQWLTVEGLCRELHVTRRTLQNGFQEVTAMSPLPFLRALRLNQVRRLLRSPQGSADSIQQLAEDWGFASPSHFSYDYRRLFGETPSQTRQQPQRLGTFRLDAA
ncbi:helix-turn-helix domain-containing protein [Aquitalea sp. USM4]|uniref:helix-turn-helix domain-containing protein n=1 Tax=Aquitalea sp. USM4 TaxID=1590041 RepID=UPI0013F14781|nr:helix-turn-helix domain-containing protein [Aquitalea sp. USM4]